MSTIQRDEVETYHRYTAHEAEPVLEMSAEAVRRRAARGPLGDGDVPDGIMYLRSDTNRTATSQGAVNGAISPSELIGNLRSYIESLKSELAARSEELRRREEEHQAESFSENHLLAGTRVHGPKVSSTEPQNGRGGYVESPTEGKQASPYDSQEAQTGGRVLRSWRQRLLGF